MQKITRELANKLGFYFDDLLLDISYHRRDHRKGDTFFVNALVEINEKHFPKVPRVLDGLYVTNNFIIQDGWGYEYSDIYELLPCELVTKVVTIEEIKLIPITD